MAGLEYLNTVVVREEECRKRCKVGYKMESDSEGSDTGLCLALGVLLSAIT